MPHSKEIPGVALVRDSWGASVSAQQDDADFPTIQVNNFACEHRSSRPERCPNLMHLTPMFKVGCKLPSSCASASASLSLVIKLIYVLFYLETIDTKNCLFILGRPVIASSRYIWYNTVTIQTKESRATPVNVFDYPAQLSLGLTNGECIVGIVGIEKHLLLITVPKCVKSLVSSDLNNIDFFLYCSHFGLVSPSASLINQIIVIS